MNSIERFKSSYRAYFEYYKTHKTSLNRYHFIQMIGAIFLMLSMVTMMGLVTQQLTVFLYVFVSLTVVISVTSFLYSYFSSGYNTRHLKSIYVIPWLKWMVMFLWYQGVILQNLYIKLVPTVFILLLAFYPLIALICFYGIERKLNIKSMFISKTLNTALLLYLMHNILLYIIPIRDITLSYVLVVVSIILLFMFKHFLNIFIFDTYKPFQKNLVGKSYFLLLCLLYLIVQGQPALNRVYGMQLFRHESIFRDELIIERQVTLQNDEILQMMSTPDLVYLRTQDYVYVLDHDLSIQHAFRNTTMSLLDTSRGVMLIEYQQKDQDSQDQNYYFSVYDILPDGSIKHYLAHYTNRKEGFYYIHFNEAEIFYFVPLHESGLSGTVIYYDGTKFKTTETYEKRVIKTDDVYIGFDAVDIFGIHRKYGTYMWSFYTPEGTDLRYLSWYTEIEEDGYNMRPHYYGYQHTIHLVEGGIYYVHKTSNTYIRSHYIGGFLTEFRLHLQPDGTFYLVDKHQLIVYDDAFNIVTRYKIDGMSSSVDKTQFEETVMFYVMDDTLYKVDLEHIGSYVVIHHRTVLQWIWISGFALLCLFWKTYTLKPNAY